MVYGLSILKSPSGWNGCIGGGSSSRRRPEGNSALAVGLNGAPPVRPSTSRENIPSCSGLFEVAMPLLILKNGPTDEKIGETLEILL